MRFRVPLTLDAVTRLLKEAVARTYVPLGEDTPAEVIKACKKSTQRNDSPRKFRDLINAGVIHTNIDPHRNILSMARMVSTFDLFQEGYSFGPPSFLHNYTEVTFICSDNPVCYFVGKRNASVFKPYSAYPGSELCFVFPIDSKTALVNQHFARRLRTHNKIIDKKMVRSVNRIIAKFSYRYLFSSDFAHLREYKEYSNSCPSPSFEGSSIGDGEVFYISYEFSSPSRVENSWSYDIERG